ncbi:MAG TPA: NAD-dependent epimerase/dehydratase family protein [Solirubrobacterales bacterium]|jgi:hypothetical protein|nr:NAD-dependent epimerase/dehydratase family protein [Solirubrobacterales bacterium]
MTAPLSRDACVIGAQGALGGAVVAQFESAGWTVHPAGRRPGRRGDFRQLDLDRPEAVAPALRNVDLVVSTVPHPDWAAERTVLGQGSVLVNCSHAPGRAAAAIAAEANGPKGTVLLNAGLVPGVTNLVAADLLGRHPEADCLEVAFTVLSAGTAGKAGGEFVHHGLTSRRHHRVVELPMPAPFGELSFIEVAEGEDGGFGGVAGQRGVETYLGFGDWPLSLALRTMNALRLISVLPKAAFALDRSGAAEASREPTAIWVGARRGAERLGASVLECEGDYRTTAAAARLFGELLLEGNARPGCFNPEDLFSLSDLLPALHGIGVRVTSDWRPNTPVGAEGV